MGTDENQGRGPADGMTVERAREITAACVRNRLGALGVLDGEHPLPDCSLEEMLVANRIVAGPAGKIQNQSGTTTVLMTVDPRGIAAAYALQKFGGPAGLLEALGYKLRGPDDEDEEEGDEAEEGQAAHQGRAS